MKVWDDRIEIWNDGGLPYDMTIEKLKDKHSSKPRNTNIASVFYKAGFIESWGRGILKIEKGFKDAGLKAPEFKEHCGGVLVVLYRPTNDMLSEENAPSKHHPSTSQASSEQNLSSIQKQILSYCETPKSTKEIMEHINYKSRKHFRTEILQPLLNGGMLRMTIPDKPNSSLQKYVWNK